VAHSGSTMEETTRELQGQNGSKTGISRIKRKPDFPSGGSGRCAPMDDRWAFGRFTAAWRASPGVHRFLLHLPRAVSHSDREPSAFSHRTQSDSYVRPQASSYLPGVAGVASPRDALHGYRPEAHTGPHRACERPLRESLVSVAPPPTRRLRPDVGVGLRPMGKGRRLSVAM